MTMSQLKTTEEDYYKEKLMDEPIRRAWFDCFTKECNKQGIIYKSFNGKPAQSWCLECYDNQGLSEALKYCHDNKLTSLESQKEFCRKGWAVKRI